MNDDPRSSDAPHVETEQARQGVTGHNVRYVLYISSAAAVAALILVGIFVL